VGDPPAVSVVIPLYNKARYVERCLRSVAAQTIQDFEAIIVDDGSTDDSASLVKPFLGERFRLVTQENSGPSAARNRGLREARADLVAFLDADDWWEPAFLERLHRFLLDWHQAAIVGCRLIDPSTGQMALRKRRVLPASVVEGIVPNYFKTVCDGLILSSSSVMVRKAAIVEAGAFDTRFRVGEDVDCWGRIALRHPVGFVEDNLAWYHRDRSRVVSRRGVRNPFVETAKAALAEGRAMDPEGLRQYVDHLLYTQMKALLVDGRRAEVRRILAEDAEYSRRYRLRFLALSVCALLPTEAVRGPMELWWGMRRLLRCIARGPRRGTAA